MTEGPEERSGELGGSEEDGSPTTAADGRGSDSTGEGDEGGRNGDPDWDRDEETDTDLAARVETLERTVEELQGTVERQRRDISYLAAAADVESVEPICPECGEGTLQTSSGLTWRQASCPECGLKQYL